MLALLNVRFGDLRCGAAVGLPQLQIDAASAITACAQVRFVPHSRHPGGQHAACGCRRPFRKSCSAAFRRKSNVRNGPHPDRGGADGLGIVILAVLVGTPGVLVLIWWTLRPADEIKVYPARQINPQGGGIAWHMPLVRRIGSDRIEWGIPFASSCTLIIAAPGLCLVPGATMMLHPSRNGWPLWPPSYRLWVSQIMAFYPPAVRSTFAEVARTWRMRTLSYDQLIRLGFRAC